MNENTLTQIKNILSINGCIGVNCDEVPFEGGCLDCKLTRIKQLVEQELQLNEKCTCNNFHEGNCTKSNFYEYEIVEAKYLKAVEGLHYVLDKCQQSVYFKDPDIEEKVRQTIVEIEEIE
jgi:hypothetical protein